MNGYAVSRVEVESGRAAAQNAVLNAALVAMVSIRGLSSLASWRCLNAAQLEQYYSCGQVVRYTFLRVFLPNRREKPPVRPIWRTSSFE
jgi:hypothetical protein